jgi:hypothetical protein
MSSCNFEVVVNVIQIRYFISIAQSLKLKA